MVYFIGKGFTKDIEFAERERMGVRYERALYELHEAVADETQSTGGTGGRVEGAFAALHEMQGALGGELEFTEEGLAKRKRSRANPARVEGEWRAIAGSSGNKWEARQHLLADVRTMITHAGDTSNLILDPDLDSYYSVDATTAALPQALGRLAELGQVLSNPGEGEAYRQKLAVFAARIQESDLDKISGDLQTVLNEDANFYGRSESLQARLPGVLRRYQESGARLVHALQAGASESGGREAISGVAQEVAESRRAALELLRTANDELDVLLSKRVETLASMRRSSLLWTVFSLLLVALVGYWVIHMTTQVLHYATGELLDQSTRIVGASGQITGISTGLASGASEQAASIEETSASTQEIHMMANQNVSRARAVKAKVDGAQRLYGEVSRQLEETIEAMEAITNESGNISRIIRVIDEIAFQTSILSLNAAVEAARAGQSGLGFAVVAEEVRNLAQRSAQAAKDTASMIENSILKSSQGRVKIDQLAKAVSQIMRESDGIRELVEEVEAGSVRQTRDIEQIANVLSHIDRVTQQNAASAEEAAASAEELNAQTGVLREVASRVSALVG